MFSKTFWTWPNFVLMGQATRVDDDGPLIPLATPLLWPYFKVTIIKRYDCTKGNSILTILTCHKIHTARMSEIAHFYRRRDNFSEELRRFILEDNDKNKHRGKIMLFHLTSTVYLYQITWRRYTTLCHHTHRYWTQLVTLLPRLGTSLSVFRSCSPRSLVKIAKSIFVYLRTAMRRDMYGAMSPRYISHSTLLVNGGRGK